MIRKCKVIERIQKLSKQRKYIYLIEIKTDMYIIYVFLFKLFNSFRCFKLGKLVGKIKGIYLR